MLFALLVAGALTIGSVGDPVRASELSVARGTAAQAATCVDEAGPGIPPPATVTSGLPGYHAAWYGQSGYPILCPGSTATATVAFMNTGSLGWYSGRAGQAAYLGTWGPEPGQDQASVLGGTDTGWPSAGRIAAQPAEYVGPGDVAWFQFTVKAPETPGVYRLALRPLIEGTRWMEDYGVFWYVTVQTLDGAVPQLPVQPPARTYHPSQGADGSRSLRASALMYHYVGELPPDADRFRVDLTVSPADFEEQLLWLKANGYHTITSVDLWWALDTGNPLPPKPVLLTFDDGHRDHYENVLPLLLKHGMVGTFAVTANLIERPGYMTKAMVRALADAGMDVQSHAVDHVSVNRLSFEQQVYQLCTSRRLLEEWTGREVRHFIYPAGDYLPLPAAALTGCGYLSAYRKDGGSVQSSSWMYELRRYRVRGQQGLAPLLVALAQ
ncbi:MAG: polysaccharide deacetylase family protein [Candidatus Limnocylindria bacterium]